MTSKRMRPPKRVRDYHRELTRKMVAEMLEEEKNMREHQSLPSPPPVPPTDAQIRAAKGEPQAEEAPPAKRGKVDLSAKAPSTGSPQSEAGPRPKARPNPQPVVVRAQQPGHPHRKKHPNRLWRGSQTTTGCSPGTAPIGVGRARANPGFVGPACGHESQPRWPMAL